MGFNGNGAGIIDVAIRVELRQLDDAPNHPRLDKAVLRRENELHKTSSRRSYLRSKLE